MNVIITKSGLSAVTHSGFVERKIHSVYQETQSHELTKSLNNREGAVCYDYIY